MSESAMRDESRVQDSVDPKRLNGAERSNGLHPTWEALIRICERLQFGELEKVRIQNGLPMTVEVVRTKIRLGSE